MRTVPLLATFALVLSSAALGCSAGDTTSTDDLAVDESELRGDVTYVRGVAEAAGKSYSLEGIEAVHEVGRAVFPASLVTRIDRIVDENTYGSDPERPGHFARFERAFEIVRDGRVVGRIAEIGIAETWGKPAFDEEDDFDPGLGLWIFFDARNRKVAELEW